MKNSMKYLLLLFMISFIGCTSSNKAVTYPKYVIIKDAQGKNHRVRYKDLDENAEFLYYKSSSSNTAKMRFIQMP